MDFVQFEDNGRTLTCRRASSPATPGTTWWWLEVSGDAQRYAAFGVEPSDTPENVRTRMLAWHAQMLIERARPREVRQRWGRPAGQAPAGQAPAAPQGGSAG